jgi:hypothetical protein
MSSAVYPLGMNSYNNRTNTGGYKSWKGDGPFRNPTGITSGNTRPLTNKDYRNSAPAAFGRPRPMKHYRRGIAIPVPVMVNDPTTGELVESFYYSNREVNSSVQDKMVAQMQDQPGRYIVKDNGLRGDLQEGEDAIDDDCRDCRGIGIVSGWMPIKNLTEKPQPNVTNPLLCCNQQRKAVRRARPASTLLNKNYYQTTGMYLYNRCQTFKQREFNFSRGEAQDDAEHDDVEHERIDSYPFVTEKVKANGKPGGPLSELNLYVAQCTPAGLIDHAVIYNFVQLLLGALVGAGIITVDEYAALKTYTISSLKDLEVALAAALATSPKMAEAMAFVADVVKNPRYSSIIHGPSNPRGCKRVYYKPNNPQFAKQGAVANSTRLLKLNVQTIETNAANIKRDRSINVANELVNGNLPATPFIYKMKSPACTPGIYSKNGNTKSCGELHQ